MQPVVVFALFAMTLVGLADFVYKRAALAGAVPGSFLLVQSWFFGATALLFGIATGSLRYHPSLLLGPLAAVTVFSGMRLFLVSLRHGEATVNAPILRLNFVVTVALAMLFLGESMTAWKGTGFVLAASSILLLAGFSVKRFVRGGLSQESRRSILLAVAGMGCMGVLGFLYAIAARLGATGPSFIFSQFCGFTLISLFHALYRERGLCLDRAVWVNAPFAGAFNSAGLICLILALQHGEASVAVPISQMSFVMTTVLAVVLHGEGLTWRKVLGLAAALLTIAAFAR